MGSLSIWHWILVIGVALVLFGGGSKLSKLGGDLAGGIKNFRKGMAEGKDEPKADPAQAKVIDGVANANTSQTNTDKAAHS